MSYSLLRVIRNEIAKGIKDKNTVFIFPTSVVSDSWMERIVFHPEEFFTDDEQLYCAVRDEQFIAWDRFKSSCICESNLGNAQNQLTPVPSLLRKIYSHHIVTSHSFKKIISPLYPDSASSFAPWISTVLPSLGTWKKYFDDYTNTLGSNSRASQKNVRECDDEDEDFLFLYEDYSQFLKSNSFYEPSWSEKSFDANGKKYILFFPEILDDFSDYKEMLADGGVKFVNLSESAEDIARESPKCKLFSNLRTELRDMALNIRALHYKKNIDWSDIALSVPDIENLRPYVERELELYCIPYRMRAGNTLTLASAGRIFEEIQSCVKSDFSFDSMRALLLDGLVPWRNIEYNKALIKLGTEAKCICSFIDKGSKSERNVDTWESSLPDMKILKNADPCNPAPGSAQEGFNPLQFYRELKSGMLSLSSSKSFKEVRTNWAKFKSQFLDDELFSKDANLIIGLCIRNLEELISIEETVLNKDGCKIKVQNCYDFFVTTISSASYQPQNKIDGISVFPYRLSAAAAYPYQFVINANQKKLSVEKKHFDFLSQKKREQFKISDSENPSVAFIRLYNKSCVDLPDATNGKNNCDVYFSTSQNTIGGFAIPHGYLTPVTGDDGKEIVDRIFDEQNDFVKSEKSFLCEESENFPAAISKNQDEQFKAWQSRSFNDINELSANKKISSELSLLLKNKFMREYDNNKNQIAVSATHLKSFSYCPRSWLFDKVISLDTDSLDVSMYSNFDIGKIYHKMLEIVFKKFDTIPAIIDDSLENESEIRDYLRKNMTSAFCEVDSYGDSNSVLVKKVLDSSSENFINQIIYFLQTFSKKFSHWHVYASEKEYKTAGENINFFYNGKIDCILTDDNGTVAIVDFKTGKLPSQKECFVADDGTVSDYQMAMYIHLFESNSDSVKVEKASFYSIWGDKISEIIKLLSELGKTDPEKKLEEQENKKANMIEVLKSDTQAFADSVQNAIEKFEPFLIDAKNINQFEYCSGCSYQSVCRTQYTVSPRSLKDEYQES